MNKIIYLMTAAILAFSADAFAGEHHGKHGWLEKQNAEITEDYNEAMAKINASSFSDEQKAMLKAQADSNKALAMEQAKVANEQMMKNAEARKPLMNGEKHHDKKAKKIFEEIDDIL